MRVAYTCHDSFPSSDTNTQQIFWTLFEITRLGLAVDLFVPSVRAGADGREAIARHYGSPTGTLPPAWQLVPRGTADCRGSLAKGWFDWQVSRTIGRGAYDVVWTRDAVA